MMPVSDAAIRPYISRYISTTCYSISVKFYKSCLFVFWKLKVRRLRSSNKRHRCPQSVGEYSRLSGRLGQSVDRLQLRHGINRKYFNFHPDLELYN